MKNILIILISFVSIVNVAASDLDEKLKIDVKDPIYEYEKPSPTEFITNSPDDFVELYDMSTSKDSLWIWGAIIGSTAILMHYDEDLVDWATDLGDRYNINGSGEETSKVLLSAGPYPILKFPTDNGSALYFIGDGTVHVGIMAGFLGYGYFADNNKALNVGSQLAEGLIGVAITTQVLKHVTGRETPNTSTQDGGKWDFFPNQADYAEEVPKFDAFPSGHLATAMMTTTVLHENYPNNPYILPVSYTLMTLLSIQMLNNGVHWASDYPLAIAIGYSFGKIVSKRQRDKFRKNEFTFAPQIFNDGYGMSINYKF